MNEHYKEPERTWRRKKITLSLFKPHHNQNIDNKTKATSK
jgi:hypothetical protein